MKWLKCSKINFSTDSNLNRVYIRVNERLNARTIEIVTFV